MAMPDESKIDADDLCTMIGGEFDFESNQCSFTMPGEHERPSIRDSTTFLFFVLQVIIGCATTIFAVYYNPISIPAEWWTQYIVLFIAAAIAFVMYWIKTNAAGEAIARAAASTAIILAFSTALGCLLQWDILAYSTPVLFATEPVTATISGVIVAALISFVISPPEERKESSKAKQSAGMFPLYK